MATRVTTTDNPCKRIGRDFCRAISRDFSNTAATTTGGITPDAGHGNLDLVNLTLITRMPRPVKSRHFLRLTPTNDYPLASLC
jgi:hypothetical protein